MTSPSISQTGIKLFQTPWTITIPADPSLKFYRATPAHLDVWQPLVTNPANNTYTDTKDKVWDSAAIAKWRQIRQEKYAEANKAFNHINVLVELDGKVAGYGGVYPTKPGQATVGLVLEAWARGKGVGKLTVVVLVQLGHEMGLVLDLATLKANKSMRGLMASMGIEEKEEILIHPERGLLAELTYTFPKDKWEPVEMDIHFEA